MSMYKFELHLHTDESSGCGKVPAKDAVALYMENGYDGFVVTDHFNPYSCGGPDRFAKDGKELSEEELQESDDENNSSAVDEKYTLIDAAKLLVANKYYLMICATYILQQLYGAMLGAGTFYMKYVMGDENLFSYFAWAINIPLIIALVVTPALVTKWRGMYKLNFWGYALGTLGRLLVMVAAYMGNIPLMFLFTGVAAFGMGPWQGDMNAVIAEASQYTYLTKGKRVDGTMYSCTSLGVKLGGGIGVALQGWLLEFAGYDGTLTVQPASCITMLNVMYLVLPVVFTLIITFIMSRMKVEKANAEIMAAKNR